jgi:hypothetical protein
MKKKRHAFAFLICAILAVLVFASCAKRKVDPVGIYLTEGGRAYTEIVRDSSDNLIVKGTLNRFPGRKSRALFDGQDLMIWFEEKRLIPEEWEELKIMPFIRLPIPRLTQMDSGTYYELVPSSIMPGDWDLIRYYWWLEFDKERPSKDDISSLKLPHPSFLHRVDDSRVVEYFSSMYEYPHEDVGREELAARFFELASGLLASYPDDLYVRTVYLDALLRKGAYEIVEERLKQWRQGYETAQDPFLREAFRMAEGAVNAKRLTDAGRNGCDFATEVLGPDYDLASRMQRFPDILHYEEYAAPLNSLIAPTSPGILNFMISLKVFQVEAIFRMFQGKRDQAVKILVASYHFGQLMSETKDFSIDQVIGSWFRSIACKGLQVYALNWCERADEFHNLWKILEGFDHRAQKLDLQKADVAQSMPLGQDQLIEDFYVRYRSGDVHFQLLRLAMAAKYRFVTQQAFPSSAGEFAPLLPDGPPKDPFGTEPLKFIAAPEKFTCYSIGPDEQDNQASVSYDPTNGTVSRGDIVLEVPREREYPFPRNRVKAATAEELRRQFPNGLPADPFADTRGRPLGISNTTPVYIYSYGPDTDESEARRAGDRYVPEIQYDPTNGTISQGDLFIAIPPP